MLPPPRRASLSSMSDNKMKASADETSAGEISNVDLQFQHTRSEAELHREDVEAELREESAPGEFHEEGLTAYDVTVEDSMDASDPPSSNMGDEGKE